MRLNSLAGGILRTLFFALIAEQRTTNKLIINQLCYHQGSNNGECLTNIVCVHILE